MRYIIKCVNCHRPGKVIQEKKKDLGKHTYKHTTISKTCDFCGGQIKEGLE